MDRNPSEEKSPQPKSSNATDETAPPHEAAEARRQLLPSNRLVRYAGRCNTRPTFRLARTHHLAARFASELGHNSAEASHATTIRYSTSPLCFDQSKAENRKHCQTKLAPSALRDQSSTMSVSPQSAILPVFQSMTATINPRASRSLTPTRLHRRALLSRRRVGSGARASKHPRHRRASPNQSPRQAPCVRSRWRASPRVRPRR